MAQYHRVVGIDLGTTFSVVSVYELGKSDVVVIPNKQNQRTTASVVYIGKNGQIAVGEAARRKLEQDPGGVVLEAKRKMGEKTEGGVKVMIPVAGREFEPEFISACILKELKACAERFIGEPIHDAVITVPAYFKEPQKNATREAALLARLNPRLLVNEPTAAAVAYGLDDQESATFIVYDFGGGTFDVSIVRATDGHKFDILGTGGDANLGGGDIDQKIVDWALGRMQAEHGRDFSRDAKLVGRLRLEAERVKINLCNQESSQEFFLANVTTDIEEINYSLGPAEFKKMIRAILEKTREQVDIAMDSAKKRHGLTWDDVDSFILVGGSSKMPFVRQLLAETYKKPVKSDLNPDEIVSIGAARLAVDYPPSQGVDIHGEKEIKLDKDAPVPQGLVDTQIKDVVSHTLGIGLKGDAYNPLIEKDKYIPHKVTRTGYTTAEDNQTNIYIPVYQGDNPKASLNFQLGEVVISDLTPAPVGTHRFEVTFALDQDGVFFGEVLHNQTGVKKEIKLQRGQGALVEKRRVDLADALDRGNVTVADTRTAGAGGAPGGSGTAGGGANGSAAKPVDRVAEIIAQAQRMQDSLPANDQAELSDAISQLTMARINRNDKDQTTAMIRISAVLSRHQAG